MRGVRFRPKALADIAEIRRYTRKAWGAAQARKYLNELEARFAEIAEGFALAVIVSAEGQSFMRCRHKEHLIFFEETPDTIEIVRVLHPRRNIDARLRES